MIVLQREGRRRREKKDEEEGRRREKKEEEEGRREGIQIRIIYQTQLSEGEEGGER